MKYLTVGLLTFVGLVLLAASVRTSATASPPVPPPPTDTTAVPATPARPVVDPTRDTYFWCRHGNPSCGRDLWWAEFEAAPQPGKCSYSFLPATFTTDCGLAEAVVNTVLYPEGRALLDEAAAWGVTVLVVPQSSLPRTAIAVYMPNLRQVRVGDQWHRVSTWMVSAVLVHEFTHARQHQRRQLAGSCPDVETPAYQAGVDYVRWLATRMGGLPSQEEVATTLSADDARLFDFLVELLATPDLRPLVVSLCGRSHAGGSVSGQMSPDGHLPVVPGSPTGPVR